MFEKTIRCTVCTWRGSWDAAMAAPRVRRSDIPPSVEEIQTAYEEQQAARVNVFGSPQQPPCPQCGHHTVVARRSASIHPAM